MNSRVVGAMKNVPQMVMAFLRGYRDSRSKHDLFQKPIPWMEWRFGLPYIY
jgi:hypothetical protein